MSIDEIAFAHPEFVLFGLGLLAVAGIVAAIAAFKTRRPTDF